MGQPAVTVVVGPAWADTSAKPQGVLNPLRVQNHVTRMAGVFVPGVIVTTTLARYYGLHPWLASVAAEQDLDREGYLELVRRCEVALAWVSAQHSEHLAQLPIAHGEEQLPRFTSGGVLDLTAASRPLAYMQNPNGFLASTYANSEVELGLLTPEWTPGPRFSDRARAAVAGGLGALLELARASTLSEAEGADAARSGLCVCSARVGEEGAWLRDLLCGRLGGERWAPLDDARRSTAMLLTRVIAHSTDDVIDPIRAMRHAVVYNGPLDQSPATAGIEIAAAWRGLMLRHLAVTAWRQLWVAIVAECVGVTATEVAQRIAEHFDDVLVGEFVGSFRTVEGERLLPTEEQAMENDPGVVGAMGVLASVAQRVGQLEGAALDVLCGDDEAELGPRWMAAQLAAGREYRLREWVAQRVTHLLERSQRIGLEKFRLDEDGRGVIPLQVRERDGLWRQVGETGSSPLNLRLRPLADVLAGCGILDHHDDVWSVTEVGTELIGED